MGHKKPTLFFPVFWTLGLTFQCLFVFTDGSARSTTALVIAPLLVVLAWALWIWEYRRWQRDPAPPAGARLDEAPPRV